MTVSRLKCFYLANKAMLDTRLDLLPTLLTQISQEGPQCPVTVLPSTELERYDQATTTYSEFDLLDEQLFASPFSYESTVFLDQSRW